MDYTISEAEPYGAGGLFGNKYRMTVPGGTTDEQIMRIVNTEADMRGNDKVVMGKRKLDANQLAFFVYIGREPGDGGNLSADGVFVVPL